MTSNRVNIRAKNNIGVRVGSTPSVINKRSESGYEITAGFSDRTTGTAGASDAGSNVQYTTGLAQSKTWLRFGFSDAAQLANDAPYWADPAPASADGVGLFGGRYMPPGVKSMFDYSFNESTYSDAVSEGDIKYTAATGSYDFTDCSPGDLALIRFDFNAEIQIANTTLEVGLIWQTRAADGTPTYTFTLVGDPIFFGVGSAGRTYLNRPLISAYFASEEDVNARALPAIRADNSIAIQPLTTLSSIVR